MTASFNSLIDALQTRIANMIRDQKITYFENTFTLGHMIFELNMYFTPHPDASVIYNPVVLQNHPYFFNVMTHVFKGEKPFVQLTQELFDREFDPDEYIVRSPVELIQWAMTHYEGALFHTLNSRVSGNEFSDKKLENDQQINVLYNNFLTEQERNVTDQERKQKWNEYQKNHYGLQIKENNFSIEYLRQKFTLLANLPPNKVSDSEFAFVTSNSAKVLSLQDNVQIQINNTPPTHLFVSHVTSGQNELTLHGDRDLNKMMVYKINDSYYYKLQSVVAFIKGVYVCFFRKNDIWFSISRDQTDEVQIKITTLNEMYQKVYDRRRIFDNGNNGATNIFDVFVFSVWTYHNRIGIVMLNDSDAEDAHDI